MCDANHTFRFSYLFFRLREPPKTENKQVRAEFFSGMFTFIQRTMNDRPHTMFS